jgi:DNA polymerase-3 subunit epsilon
MARLGASLRFVLGVAPRQCDGERVEVPRCFAPDAQGLFLAAALDTETSGLSGETDQIIEIGIRLFEYELPSARITRPAVEVYSALQDPGFLISPEIQSVTGLSPAMLSGHHIDWERVDALLARADVIIAHNARFDRGFVDRKSRVSPTKTWACSSTQVAWKAKGFKSGRLQGLTAALGIAHQAHRAMGDVDALVDLIGREDAMTGKPYLHEMIEDCRREVAYLWVEGRTYDQRDLLKAYGFRWNPAGKTWGKIIAAGESDKQIASVTGLIPDVTVQSRPLAPQERFKPVGAG